MSKDTDERKEEKKERRQQLFSLRKPEIRAKIKELKAQGKYEEIFSQYGRTAYSLYVPRKYKKQDLKSLKKEERYEDIYQKYGENEYNKLLIGAMYKEIKAERGLLPAIAWRSKEHFSNFLKKSGIVALSAATTLTGTMAYSQGADIRENAEKYKTEIQTYQEHIEDYTKKVSAAHLDDIQTIMEVMDNMWGNIQGYGTPEKNISGFLELDLDGQDGIGVCRNMASDVARKLEKLGYNARTLTVYMEDGNYVPANIERTVVATPEGQDVESLAEANPLHGITRYTGNHMILLVDIPSDNIILAIDPTNAGIGIYKDGEITMFNSEPENGLKLSPRQYSQAILVDGGIQGPMDVMADYMKSFETANLTDEELAQKYGVEAQNRALTQVRALRIAETAFEDRNVGEESTFDDRYKVGQDIVDKTIQVGYDFNLNQEQGNDTITQTHSGIEREE